MLWGGRVMSGLFALFMLGASIAPKLLGMPVAEQTLATLGWPPGDAVMIGVIELSCLLLFLIPRTSHLGAVAMTALFGGAIATHIRAGSPLYSHVLFGLYLGIFMWGGLWLRDPGTRAVLPFRRRHPVRLQSAASLGAPHNQAASRHPDAGWWPERQQGTNP